MAQQHILVSTNDGPAVSIETTALETTVIEWHDQLLNKKEIKARMTRRHDANVAQRAVTD
ncbi:MAG: hypothetical protein ACI9UU_001185 [Candidatus Azotimanducaceae bacterium]|jgi:hypothetical protein